MADGRLGFQCHHDSCKERGWKELRGLFEPAVFRDPTPDLFSPFALPYEYDPQAVCPKWEAYLEGVQPNPEDRQVLQMMAGLTLVPDTTYNVFFVLCGEAGSGKSVFLHVLTQLIGETNVCCPPLCRFTEKFSTWQLASHLVNIVVDMPTDTGDTRLSAVEGMLKDVCDGGLVPVEHKHQEPGTAPAVARNIFATNSLPTFSDRSNAIWDRLRVIPFEVRFRGTDHEIPGLKHSIAEEELSGMFNWAVAGLALLRRRKRFPEHAGGLAAKERHRARCDVEQVYLSQTYVPGGVDDFVESREAYSRFRNWCADNGHRQRCEHTFAEAVRRVFGMEKSRTRVLGQQKVVYAGLRPNPAAAAPDELLCLKEFARSAAAGRPSPATRARRPSVIPASAGIATPTTREAGRSFPWNSRTARRRPGSLKISMPPSRSGWIDSPVSPRSNGSGQGDTGSAGSVGGRQEAEFEGREQVPATGQGTPRHLELP